MGEPECFPPIRLNVCPRCGYSLAAHPPRGRCPECGRAYDDDEEIVLYGYAMGGRANKWNTRPPRMLGIAFGLLFCAFFFWSYVGRSPWGATVWLILLVTGVGADVWRRYAASNDTPLVQVKFSPSGFRQGTRGTGPMPFERNDAAPLEPWTPNIRIRVNFLGPGRVQIVVTQRGARWWQRLYQRERVNADVAVEQGQVEAIRRRLATWMSAEARGRIGPPMPN